MSSPAIVVENVSKSYCMGPVELKVLRNVSFDIPEGQFAAVVGASGSGKSTLLHLVGLLDRADKGSIFLNGTDTTSMRTGQRNKIRCNDVGFVFQFYHLLGELNVLENVLLPAKVNASVAQWIFRRSAQRKKAEEILDAIGLSERLKHRPSELSGGERQRVAIARALMNHPKILLADEPTGNLDSATGRQIMDVLKGWNRKNNQTLLMVTHDMALAGDADKILTLKDGRLG